MREILKKIKNITDKIAEDHISAYAAQSAFFIMLSLVPILLLLMTLVRFTPITQADIMAAAYELFPKTVSSTIISIVNEVYNQTGTAISVSLLVALWSAGKGVLAMSNGLNTIRGEAETRNYFFLRLRAAVYTILFLLAIILSLVFLGFGNSISMLVNKYAPVLKYIMDFIIETRTIVMILVLIVFSLSIYMFLPNKRRRLRSQLPGAIFTAFGWTLASFIFSVYMDIFKGFSNMYGSLTTIVIIMLWLYFCMYVMLLGGEMNDLLEQWVDNSRKNG
ncbi:MAG: YihY/virulence factor BrkB family protein [Tyzzerella sp.]|nr:YihY/virulence factor BrkB family protein [Tyzzerella sp.]